MSSKASLNPRTKDYGERYRRGRAAQLNRVDLTHKRRRELLNEIGRIESDWQLPPVDYRNERERREDRQRESMKTAGRVALGVGGLGILAYLLRRSLKKKSENKKQKSKDVKPIKKK